MEKYFRQDVFRDMSDEDIDKLLERYYYTDQKINDLMADFQISVQPSLLAASFPFALQEEVKCEYCGVPMYARFASRTLLKEKGYKCLGRKPTVSTVG